MKFLIYISLFYFVYSYTPYLPTNGETVRGHRFETGFGGKGANQCVAAAKMGSKTGLISKVNHTFNE